MCGIFGYFNEKLSIDQDDIEQRLISALNAFHHRGPDDQGVITLPIKTSSDNQLKKINIGHTRLSIIDLSDAGHQPMESKDGRYCLTYNGEIYNYKELKEELKKADYTFKSDSDTEVLLAAWQHWGENSIKRLNGMFAFAIYDKQTCTLTLVRDAFGIKPLFYYQDSSELCFASEISAISILIDEGLKPDLQQSYNYLITGEYDYGSETFYSEVKSLLPGHFVKFNMNKLNIEKYERWWWPSIKERNDISFEDAAKKLRDIFLKNVQLHIRSDVPIGAALSGGLDSSSVVCAMRYLEPDIPINTFTYVDRGSNVDEEKWADIVNKAVSSVPHKILVNAKELGDDLEDLIKTQGEPFGGTSIYAQYRVFKAAKEAGVTVTLDGQGADELLAGYNGYPHGYVLSLYEKKEYLRIIKFLNKWSKWPGRSYLQAFRLIATLTLPLPVLKFLLSFFNKSQELPEWINRNEIYINKLEINYQKGYLKKEEGRGRRLVEQLRNAMTGAGLSPLLRHGDRNSMRWSIESRVPFLTTELAEFVLSLPESYLISENGQTKYIFREAMRGIVPDEILDRRDKIGFETPEYNWLLKHSNVINNWIASDKSKMINVDESLKVLNKIMTGEKRFDRFMWRLINYSRWFGSNFK